MKKWIHTDQQRAKASSRQSDWKVVCQSISYAGYSCYLPVRNLSDPILMCSFELLEEHPRQPAYGEINEEGERLEIEERDQSHKCQHQHQYGDWLQRESSINRWGSSHLITVIAISVLPHNSHSIECNQAPNACEGKRCQALPVWRNLLRKCGPPASVEAGNALSS